VPFVGWLLRLAKRHTHAQARPGRDLMAVLGLRSGPTMHAPRSRRMRLETGLEYHLLEWGGDDAALEHTLVLVHGFLDLAWGWQQMVSASLAGRFHVIAPDLRGHGDSQRVGLGGYYHFMDYVADLSSLIDQTARRDLSLVGHSMGGTVAAYYAGAFPDRVRRLALLEGLGPPEDPTPIPERLASWITAWRRARRREPRSYATIDEAAARLCAADSMLEPELARFLAERGTLELPDGSRRFKHDPLHTTRGPYPFRVEVAESFWRRISAPVLLVEGSESAFRGFGEEGERRAACLPHARREQIAGAGHMLQRHRPVELGRLLADFFS
jgi:pimeloyl-ACP methyl ester carboxylesterase